MPNLWTHDVMVPRPWCAFEPNDERVAVQGKAHGQGGRTVSAMRRSRVQERGLPPPHNGPPRGLETFAP
jgi:hypothetical protein